VSFKNDRMGTAEGIALIFTMTITTVFVTLPSEIVEASGELGWLSEIASDLSTMAMLFLFIYVLERFPGDLFHVSTCLLGRLCACLISIYYVIMFFSVAILLLRDFSENTLFAALPELDFHSAVGWYAVSVGFILYFGIEGIARAAYIILPFSAGGMILTFVLLFPHYKPYYLFPWQGTGITNALIKNGVLVATNAAAPLLAVIAKSFQSIRVLRAAAIFGLGGSMLIKSIAILILIMVFGTSTATERTLPFFEMTRLISLNRYIQRIDSIFIMLWVIAGILGIAISLYMGLYLITRLVNLPTMKPLIPLVTLLLAQFSMLPPDSASVRALESILVKGYFLIGIYVIPILLFAATLLKEKWGTKCASE